MNNSPMENTVTMTISAALKLERMERVGTLTEQYRAAVEAAIQKAYDFQAPADRPTVSVEAGRKYLKLVTKHTHQRSVHSFVNLATGDVYKPAGWKTPVVDSRYNLVTGMDTLLAAIDPYGGYLYKKPILM